MKLRQPEKYELKFPVEYGSETICELTIERPKAKHFRSLPNNANFGDILNFAAKLCGVAPSVIDELDTEDVTGLMEKVSAFLPTSLVIGNKP